MFQRQKVPQNCHPQGFKLLRILAHSFQIQLQQHLVKLEVGQNLAQKGHLSRAVSRAIGSDKCELHFFIFKIMLELQEGLPDSPVQLSRNNVRVGAPRDYKITTSEAQRKRLYLISFQQVSKLSITGHATALKHTLSNDTKLKAVASALQRASWQQAVRLFLYIRYM